MALAQKIIDDSIKPTLEKDELLRLSVFRDGVAISKDDKEPAVENTAITIGAALGTYAAHNDKADVKGILADLIRSYKLGYDIGRKHAHVEVVNVSVDDETGKVKHYSRKGTVKKTINLEDYK